MLGGGGWPHVNSFKPRRAINRPATVSPPHEWGYPASSTGNACFFEAAWLEMLKGIWRWSGDVGDVLPQLELDKETEIPSGGRFRPTGGASFGSRGPPGALLVGFSPRVKTRATSAVVARTPVRDVAEECFSRPARFSGRTLRSDGDLSPREKGPTHPSGDESPGYTKSVP